MMRWVKRSFLGFGYTFLYLPIIIIVIFSFNNARFSSLWHGFTTQWYRDLLNNHELFQIALNSLTLATLSALLSTCIGVLVAICIWRYRFFGRKALHGGLFAMIFAPDIVLGIAFLMLFNLIHLHLGFVSLLIAHISFSVPFVSVITYSRIHTLQRNVLEAAQDLGANEATIFKTIILPLMRPAIIAGFLMSFTLSLDDVIVSYFVSGPSFQILPLKIYSMAKLGVNPVINALCSLIFMITLLLVVISHFFMKRSRR